MLETLGDEERSVGSKARAGGQAFPRSLDRLLEWPLRMEAAYLRTGGSLPAGLSLLAVMRAPGGTPAAALRAAA